MNKSSKIGLGSQNGLFPKFWDFSEFSENFQDNLPMRGKIIIFKDIRKPKSSKIELASQNGSFPSF